MQKITISITSDIESRLSHFASEQKTTVEDAATNLLKQALHAKKTDGFRVVQSEKKSETGLSDTEALREIIHRQDEEIIWLREQITRLSTLTPTTHIIKHEYPAITGTIREQSSLPPDEEKKTRITEEKDVNVTDGGPSSQVSVEDVLYTLTETGIESEDLMNSGFSTPTRAGERVLRDSIGGVRGEKEYTVSEAAAIAGESEAVILEYISDGFLPAQKEGNIYRIRGVDLQRYMMSK